MKVLIVEDSEDDMLLVLRALRQGGYRPVHMRVETEQSMQLALSRKKWDLIISDYSMPAFSGVEALAILKESKLDIPFIIVSGAIGEEVAVSLMKAGANDYVAKGNLRRLLPAVERELREAEVRQERRKADKQIHKLSNALMQSASMIMIMDLTGTIDYVNRAFTQVSGYTEQELIGRNVVSLTPERTNADEPVMVVPPYEPIRLAIDLQSEWRGEIQNFRQNGELYWAAMTLSVIRDEHGHPVNFLLVQEDITERKRLEDVVQRYTEQLEEMVERRTAELRQAKEQIEVILNNSIDGILLAEPTGDVLTINPAFRQMFSDMVDGAVEGILSAIAEIRQAEALAKALLNVVYDKRSERVEASVMRPDGSIIDADLAMAPVSKINEVRSGVVLSVRDITRLKDLDRFKSRFVANAAHDLSNPIMVMKTRLYVMRAMHKEPDEHLMVLDRQVRRLEALVSDLRTLSELDRGELALQSESLNLNAMISEIVQNHASVLSDKDLNCITELDPQLPMLVLDRRKIERVLVNLVSNAIIYSRQGTRVYIETAQDEGSVLVRVSDAGIGIDPEDLPHIFERFYRSARAKRHAEHGTGLGLAIVKEMVDLHHGHIAVESVVDSGTTFIVRLPLTHA